MREEMQMMFRKVSELSPKTSISGALDEHQEELERTVRKLEKNVGLNTTKIWGAIEKI